jgi:uncharacterized protein YqgQ
MVVYPSLYDEWLEKSKYKEVRAVLRRRRKASQKRLGDDF